MVIKKATQVGVSAYCVRWAIYWAEQVGLTALYVFPYQRQLADFSAARVRPLLAESRSSAIALADGGVRNAGLMQIGRGYLYLRGSESVADLQSVDADVLVLDEYDLLAADHIPDAERRLGASEYGFIRRVGVPSLPGFGIAELYERSDRRRWHVRCDSCNERQPVSFAENIDRERLSSDLSEAAVASSTSRAENGLRSFRTATCAATTSRG